MHDTFRSLLQDSSFCKTIVHSENSFSISECECFEWLFKKLFSSIVLNFLHILLQHTTLTCYATIPFWIPSLYPNEGSSPHTTALVWLFSSNFSCLKRFEMVRGKIILCRLVLVSIWGFSQLRELSSSTMIMIVMLNEFSGWLKCSKLCRFWWWKFAVESLKFFNLNFLWKPQFTASIVICSILSYRKLDKTNKSSSLHQNFYISFHLSATQCP